MKKCTKCCEIKDICYFSKDKYQKDGLSSSCKSCDKEKNKIRKQNLDKNKYFVNEKFCPECKVKKQSSEFYSSAHSKDGLQYICKLCDNKRKSNYNKINIDKHKIWSKKHNEKNYQNIREKERISRRDRRKNDPIFALKSILRCRTGLAFRQHGYEKDSKTYETIGCSWEFLKTHIEKQFLKGMTWENRGIWHIDHIVPLSSAKNKDELKKLFHFSNLRPIWAEDNLEKKDKIIFLI